jgi:hypothetical protein
MALAVIANAGQSREAGPATGSGAERTARRDTTTTASEPSGPEGAEGLPRPRHAGRSPGTPLALARAFGEAWVNRPTEKAAVAEERSRLLGLSRGELATRINFAFLQQAGDGGDGGSRGRVIATRIVARRSGGRLLEVLVTTRDQLTEQGRPSEPAHYSLYLARLGRAGSRGYLLSDWQPQ